MSLMLGVDAIFYKIKVMVWRQKSIESTYYKLIGDFNDNIKRNPEQIDI